MGTTGPPFGPPHDIPDLTISGVLPPYIGSPILAAQMSPYDTTLVRIVQKFGKSPARIAILRGLLAYREQLSSIGMVTGYQWLSGSFMDDIEALEVRDPRDIDMVTICYRPASCGKDDSAWTVFFNSNLHLFDPKKTKDAFSCDSYFIDLDMDGFSVVDQARYWFGLFSHSRVGLWKGMLRVPLEVSQDDLDASALLGIAI